MGEFIPFALPSIGQEEIQEVVHTLESGWLTTGPKAKQFETDFAAAVGADHALAVNSATGGLHLALEAVGVGRGDRVITTPYTFTATAEVIRYLDADPVFVDVDPGTLNLSPEAVRRAIESTTPKPKAIIPVHFGGQSCALDELLALGREHGLKVVEDAAHAFPASYKGRPIGSIGDVTVFSFYVTKTIATGEGGMITTDDAGLAERIRTMRLHGINRDVFDRYTSEKPKWYYEVVAAGYKYNMPDLAAAVGIHQLAKAERFRARRQSIARRYSEAFADLPVQLPVVERPDDTHAWHLYVLRLNLPRLTIGRDEFIERMSDAEIGTSVHFIPLHVQPYWRERYGLVPEDFPNAWAAYQRAVSLPIYPEMSDETVERVVQAVTAILTSATR